MDLGLEFVEPAGTGSVWVLFRVNTFNERYERRRVLCALALRFAICDIIFAISASEFVVCTERVFFRRFLKIVIVVKVSTSKP